MSRFNLRSAAASLILLLFFAGTAAAWHQRGHEALSRWAVALLPDEVPAFVREGADVIAHVTIDPDVHRHRRFPHLRGTEAPEHFIDLELMKGAPLPATRYELVRWCAAHGVDPQRLGMVPYAVTEATQRLTIAFAEYRRWPDNEAIRHKCLVYAGLLAHYAQDLCMPLHTTVHFDGRLDAEGRSPRTGIHGRIDALPGKLTLPDDAFDAVRPVEPFDDLFAAVVAELHASHGLVDRAYALAPHFPAVDEPIADEAVLGFARERSVAAATFTARLILTAWRDSADVEFEAWLER